MIPLARSIVRTVLAIGFGTLGTLKLRSGYSPNVDLAEWLFYATAVCEVALAVGMLLLPGRVAGTVAIVFFLSTLCVSLLIDTNCGCFGASVHAEKALRLTLSGVGGMLAVVLRNLHQRRI